MDLAWWGGSSSSRASRRETIAYARLDSPDSLAIETVDLNAAPNPERADPTEPNFDADGGILCAALRRILDRHATCDRVIIALDAPLEARDRPTQPPRRRTVAKNERAGIERRQCERALQEFMGSLQDESGRLWNKGLTIQPGSPVPPRVGAIIQEERSVPPASCTQIIRQPVGWVLVDQSLRGQAYRFGTRWPLPAVPTSCFLLFLATEPRFLRSKPTVLLLISWPSLNRRTGPAGRHRQYAGRPGRAMCTEAVEPGRMRCLSRATKRILKAAALMAPPEDEAEFLSPVELDEILGIQLAVAWAGEGRCEPARLGWWATDLVEEAGGGDLMKRLAPKTFAWAGLQAAREAARRADLRARQSLSNPGKALTILHLGFVLDEALDGRLRSHKARGRPPREALPMPRGGLGTWTPRWLEQAFLSGVTPPKFRSTTAGRQLTEALPKSLVETVRLLAACLLPDAPAYPCPYYAL